MAAVVVPEILKIIVSRLLKRKLVVLYRRRVLIGERVEHFLVESDVGDSYMSVVLAAAGIDHLELSKVSSYVLLGELPVDFELLFLFGDGGLVVDDDPEQQINLHALLRYLRVAEVLFGEDKVSLIVKSILWLFLFLCRRVCFCCRL